MSAEPYQVERTSRRVIENKLLESLSQADKVAILATAEDLDLIIVALTLAEAQSTSRRRAYTELRDGLQQLMKAAFPNRI